MNKIELKGLDLEAYFEKLTNGLEIYVIPFKNVNNNYVTFSTKYGSIHSEFIPINKNKMIKVPDGIAHFLEHKLFEQEDGTDPFTFFSERGADANAFTTNLKTTFLFSGTEYVLENIHYLLDYVQSPYFTDTNVLKEKGIIEQEIKMYEDDPFTRVKEQTLYNLFVNHPYKYSIIGTTESINSITKEDLYTCYNTFYHPSNMFIVVTGNVVPETIIEEIKKNQSKKQFLKPKKIKLGEYTEPNQVSREYEEIILSNVTIPKVDFSYKIDIQNLTKLSMLLILNYIKLFFYIKLSATSELCQKLKDEQLITEDLYISSELVDNYLIITINFESQKYKEVINLIRQEISNLNITEDDLIRKKKVLTSSKIYDSDNIYNINSKIMNNLIYYGKVIDNGIDLIRTINLKDMEYVIKNISLENKSICVVKGE
ncbi:MAG: pitrilysin family protein [Bacilli bacterium]